MDCFLRVVILKITEMFWDTFSMVKAMLYRILKIMSLATFWAIFFTSSSGHPDCIQREETVD
jgi:hypothetical protein